MLDTNELTQSEGLSIHRRAMMALDALSPSERSKVIDRVNLLQNPDARNYVRANSIRLKLPEPMYMMRANPKIRILYRRNGDEVEVLDIVRKGTLDTFAKRTLDKLAVGHE